MDCYKLKGKLYCDGVIIGGQVLKITTYYKYVFKGTSKTFKVDRVPVSEVLNRSLILHPWSFLDTIYDRYI